MGLPDKLRDLLYSRTRRLAGRFGVRLVRDRPMRDPVRLMRAKAGERNVGTILDIGANTGQFGAELLQAGWSGKLVSFEPIAEARDQLKARAAGHGERWIIPPAMAIGSASGETAINVSANIVSSSLLPVGEASTSVIAETAYTRTETIQVRRLDEVVDPAWPGPFAMKLDTQGFELEVVRGATETLKRTQVIMVEMSLAPLYDGGARFADLYRAIEDAGFRCIALTEGFADYERNEVLQVDGVFVRND